MTILVLLGGLATPASADKVSDLQAKADRLVNQIEQKRSEAERFAEQVNKTNGDLTKATAEVQAAEAKLSEQDQALTTLNGALADFAVKTYMYGDQANGLSALLANGDLAESIAQRRGYSPLVLGSNQDLADTLRATRQDTDRLRQTLTVKQAAKDKLLNTLKGQRKAAEKATADLTKLQNQTNADLKQAVADREAARRAAAEAEARAAAARQAELVRQQAAAAAAQAAAAARRQPAAGAGGSVRTPAVRQDPGPAPVSFPAASPAAAKAVAIALAQRGKPYVFATSGPDTFDCSGLTSYAWGAAGVSMDHWTVAQWRQFPHVPLDALQPGDLVFFGSDIHHVGLFIGGGQMVDAPYTGAVVRVQSIYSSGLAGAVRPG